MKSKSASIETQRNQLAKDRMAYLLQRADVFRTFLGGEGEPAPPS